MKNDERAQELTALIARAETQLAMLGKIPEEDTYEDGAILRVTASPISSSPGILYTWVLLKVANRGDVGADRWYHTGDIVGGGSGHRIFYGWAEVRTWLQSMRTIVAIDEMVPRSERDEARQVAEGFVRSDYAGTKPIKWDDYVPWQVSEDKSS